MTNAYNQGNSFLLLPQMKEDRDIRSDGTGNWALHPETAFQNVAVSLEYQAPGELGNVSSVPTMWAHPLTVEMALHNPKHPIKDQVVEQWRGMLGAIALAAVKGLPLNVKRIQIGKLSYHPFDRALNRLVPDAVNALYDSRATGESHPWRDIFVFLWNNQPVGMTSPSTLVVPGERAEWNGLRWYDPSSRMLRSPHTKLTIEDKEQLWLWLQNLQLQMSNPELAGNTQSANTLTRLIDEFKVDLLPAPPEASLQLSSDDEYFGRPINRGLLRALNKPIQPAAKASSVGIVPSEGKTPEKQLLLIDPDIAERWGYRKEDIYVYQEKTLAKIDIAQIKEYKMKWQGVHCVTPADLFCSELKFIDHVADAIPGGLMPESEQTLVFEGERITPLIPISSILLEHFTPEELVSRMKFKPISGGEPQIEVSLDLPLTGMRGDGTPENYRLTRLYPLKQENALSVIPVLELWPNFQAPDWQAYYALFFDLGKEDFTFHVNFPESVEVETFQDDQGANYSLTRMETFPSLIECLDKTNQNIGLILPVQPPKATSNATWKVGVDFGTSFTNIFVGHSGTAEPLGLDDLLVKMTDSPIDTRFPTLFNYFVPERFLPVEKPLPLSSVLTTRGSNQPKGRGERAILDGRIFNPSVRTFNPQASWMETDLKWKNFDSNRLFLQHLILHVSANAIKKGAKNLDWVLSYPSAFSRNDRNMYIRTWIDLLHESTDLTGVTHRCSASAGDNSFRTESLSVAQYFADQERADMVYSTCVDMGGGTSDISIWQDNILLHQCSVKFAGRDLLSNFLELNPGFIAKRFEREENEWVGLRGGGFHAKLDVLLRWESDEWLKKKRPTLSDEQDMEGLIRLMALGVGGLYYYVGLLIKVLKAKGTYTRDYATPVYLGGNGSRLLHWLDVTGRFDANSEISSFLSRILSRGADIEDTEEETRLSSQPKDEVACGLVLDTTKLEGLSRHAADELIPGEAYLVNGTPHSWDQPMDIIDDIESFDIPNLDNLNTFLYEFHRALRELRIEGIRPLPGYRLSMEISDNTKIWQGTKRALDRIMQESAIKGDPTRIQMQPPFILGLKALLEYLGKEWAKANEK